MGKLPSEKVAVVANIDPDNYAAATTYAKTSGYVDMQEYHQLMAIVQAGDMAASATIDAKLQQASSATGASVKDITSKGITQLVCASVAASGDSNKQAVIDLLTDELDVANGFRWVRLAMRTMTAASDAGAVLLGLQPRYGPATNNDASTVDEIVN